MPMTVARYIQSFPTGKYVMSPHRRASVLGAVKSRPTRSGAFGARASWTVVSFPFRRWRPVMSAARISRATRLWLTAGPRLPQLTGDHEDAVSAPVPV